MRVKGFDLMLVDLVRMVIDAIHEAKKSLFRIGQSARLNVFENRCDEGLAGDVALLLEKYGRDRGVGFLSERAMITFGCISRDELTNARSQWSFLAHDFLSEAAEVLRRLRLEREEVPDLRVLTVAACPHHVDEVGKRAWLRIGFDAGQEHRRQFRVH